MIVCVGRGIGGAENVQIAEDLASALAPRLGASRPVIDSGWLPKVRQIGKSERTCDQAVPVARRLGRTPSTSKGCRGRS